MPRPDLDRKALVSAARAKAAQNAPRVKAPADLWAQLEAERASVSVERPTGGFTRMDYARKFGLTRDAAKSELDRLAAKGTIVVAVPGRTGQPAYYLMARPHEPRNR